MSETSIVQLICAYCGRATDGVYSIDRDGFAQGPEVPLCDTCAINAKPSVHTIWAKIGQSDVCLECDEEIRSDDERSGSYHAWCALGK